MPLIKKATKKCKNQLQLNKIHEVTHKQPTLDDNNGDNYGDEDCMNCKITNKTHNDKELSGNFSFRSLLRYRNLLSEFKRIN